MGPEAADYKVYKFSRSNPSPKEADIQDLQKGRIYPFLFVPVERKCPFLRTLLRLAAGLELTQNEFPRLVQRLRTVEADLPRSQIEAQSKFDACGHRGHRNEGRSFFRHLEGTYSCDLA